MSRTIQANRAVIAELAASAFAQHAIEVVLEDEPTRTFIYRCRRPHEGFYGFTAVFHPGLVVIVGDTGPLMLRGPDRDFWATADVDFDYVLGKRDARLRGAREWMPGQVTAWLEERIEDCAGDREAARRWCSILREWRDSGQAVSDATEILGEVCPDAWELIDDCYDACSANQWGVHALRCWARLYRDLSSGEAGR